MSVPTLLQPRQHPHLKSDALDGRCFGAAISAIESLSLDPGTDFCAQCCLAASRSWLPRFPIKCSDLAKANQQETNPM